MEKVIINDLMEISFLAGVRYNPTGDRFAFAKTMANLQNGYDTNLWCGTNHKLFQLTSSGKEQLFLWENDDTILFSSKRGETKQEENHLFTDFYRLNVQGGEGVLAFSIPAQVGKIELFRSNQFVLLAQVDSLEEEKDPYEENYQVIDELPFWSNAEGFTNKKHNHLYLYHSDSQELQPLFPLEENYEVLDFCLNKEHNKLVFSATNRDGVMPLTQAVYLWDFATSQLTPLLEQSEQGYRVDHISFWKNDVVFAGSRMQRYGLNENAALYLLHTENGQVELLGDFDLPMENTVGTDCRKGSGITFKVQGDTLYFLSTKGYCTQLFSFSLTNRELTQVTNSQGSVDYFDCSMNHEITIVCMERLGLQELYQIPKDGPIVQRSLFNQWLSQNKTLGQLEHYTFLDSQGISVDGWALLPPDYDSTKKYPTILHIHGGPKTVFGEVYHHEMQVWANLGYIVIFSNPRGGDGKGNDFADIRGKYGTIDYENLMQFSDYMIQQYPSIDTQRMGVTGGSYGGYMTNWIIGHTSRFAAAASQRSIGNWVTLAGISDIGYYFSTDQVGCDCWSNPQEVWNQSPLKYVPEVTTPTLFIHSDEDCRCPVAEAYQMYTGLKLHNVPTKLVVFHGENHDLSRSGRPEGRKRRMQEIVDWFADYLLEK